ncbi:hypothetical protein H1R20_g2032, partial [Candolleomyces eurysporus]
MNPGHGAEPGPVLRVGDSVSDKATITGLRRSLREAEHNVKLWQEQAEEARAVSIQCKSNVKVLQEELESTQQELDLLQDQYRQQAELISAQKEEIEAKTKLLNDCKKALTQVTVLIDQNLADTECKDKSAKKEAEDLQTKCTSQERIVEDSTRDVQSTTTAASTKISQTRGEMMSDVGSHHRRVNNQAKALETKFNAAKKHIHMQDEELKAVLNELSAVKQQLSDAVNLSEVRGKELKGAQVFLTKADTLSVADVVQKVNALNEEIFQMAAFLGKVFVHEVLEPDANRQEHRREAIQSMYEKARDNLGETLTNTLARESVNELKEGSNPLLVQTVMQIALTNWCGHFGRRWTSYHRADIESANEAKEGQPKEPRSESGISKQLDHDRFISELYDSIRDHQDQAVAGRWRSLTKAHLPFSTTGWDHSLMLAICSIMSVAGWDTRSTEDIAQVEKRLSSIFKPLLDLRKATGEDVTSADLEVSIIQPGAIFDPSYMEDAYANGSSSSKSKKSAPEAVIGTSGLGLQRLVVKRIKTGGVQRQLEILSMPKVVLSKTIKGALEPPPSTKKKAMSGASGAGSTGISLWGVLGL